MPYDAVHFFIDESGDLSGPWNARRLDLVGGVLLLGNYDEKADERLRELLRKRLEEQGGRFPDDLHFYDNKLLARKQDAFLQALAADLPAWAGNDRTLYGISTSFRDNLSAGKQGLLAEEYYDNRYLTMLWSLVEHLLFVNDDLRRQRTEDAKVYLHVANRTFLFNPRQIQPDELRALGYAPFEIAEGRNRGKWAVDSILYRGDLLTMLRMALRQRWPLASLHLGEINVHRMNYEGKGNPAALYLADLYLGLMREVEMKARWPNHNPRSTAPLLGTFCKLEHGPGLELLAQMQAALEAGNLEQYLAFAEQYDALKANLSAYQSLVARQEAAAAQLTARAPERVRPFLEETCRIVDLPGRVFEGGRRLKRLSQLLPNPGLHARVLMLQARLSQANHTGNVRAADKCWKTYEQIEPQLRQLGQEGWHLWAEIRNRRAVSLLDHFQYGEAEKVLRPVIQLEEEIRTLQRPHFGESQVRELGACWGTLGQLYAFMGTAEKRQEAEPCFREAMKHFTAREDQERQWVYLGHLACDQGASAGKPLWTEVCHQMPELAEDNPITRAGGPFLLALQLKGLLCFAPVERLRAFLERWRQERPIEQYPAAQARAFPFGLIYQAAALAYARAWRESRAQGSALRRGYAKEALKHYDEAAKCLHQGGELLRVLALATRLRRQLFAAECGQGDAPIKETVKATFLGFTGLLASEFQKAAWDQDASGRGVAGVFGSLDSGGSYAERARAVLAGIRFNYW